MNLRPLFELDQFDDAIGIMVATWGEFQLPPREVMTALAHSGNVPLGAYDGERIVGFVLGWAGVDEGGLHVHSHMLAALPERRHRGVGYALKLGQRAQALDQDIHVARWTFDPLVARNAWFNLGKLGAVADRFGRAFYGEMTDEINRGDRTDRLVVRWELDPAPAPTAGPEGLPTVLAADGDPDAPVPARVGARFRGGGRRGASRARRLRRRDAELASRWRDAAAEALEACFGAGLIVGAFDRRTIRVRPGARGVAVSRVRAIELLMAELPLVRPFRTSFGEMTDKRCVLVRVETDDAEGWGECVADSQPDFSGEFNEGAWLVLRDFLAPPLFRAGDVDVEGAEQAFAEVRGNPMAKAALLDALVDAELRANGTSLRSWLGAERERVECGVSIGIASSTEALLDQVDGYLEEGYRRIKLKIEPGIDVERVGAVRACPSGHPALRRRERRVHAGRRRRLPFDGGRGPPDDRAAPPSRGPPPARGAPGAPAHRPLPRRVDPFRRRRRRRPRPRRRAGS